MSTATESPDAVLGILDAQKLAALGAGFDRDLLLSSAPKSFPYGKVGPFVGWVGSAVYADESSTLSPLERELVLVAITATARDPFPFAVHAYWALMESLAALPDRNPVERVADTVMTAGAYAGINGLRWGLDALVRLLNILRLAAASQETKTGDILRRADFLAAFRRL